MDPPLLILTRDDPNRFAGYLAELLRMEGLNWFRVRDLDLQPLSATEQLPRVVLVCAVALDERTALQLATYVRAGGALLAARPCAALAEALGLAPPQPLWYDASLGADDAAMAGRYVMLNAGSPIVSRLPWVAGGVQYQGRAAAYLPHGSSGGLVSDVAAVAWLAPFPSQPTRYPAVLTGEAGRGQLAVFAFDPAESAVRQQQGRPEQASSGARPDFDGDNAFRPNDLFLGQLDPALRDVPQADLQRTLLVRVLEWLTRDLPLPRVWRFPAGAAAMAFVDGDSDSMSAADLQLALDTCDRYGAPYTTYLKPEHLDVLEPASERAQRTRGHSFGPHPFAGPQPTAGEARAALDLDCAAFAARYGYRPRLHRSHWLIWPGWVDHARSLAAAGIRLDASFSAGRGFQGGYVNGTGLPAWFTGEDGRVLDVCEQSTISTDDGWLSAKTGLPALTLAGAIARSAGQIDAATDRYHTVYHPYFHPVLLKGGRALPFPTLPWLQAVLAHCRYRGVPFLDAQRWIDWNAARRSLRLVDLLPERETRGSESHGIRFSLHAGAAIEQATVIVPVPNGAEAVISGPAGEDGSSAATVVRHGRRYAAVTCSLRAAEIQRFHMRWNGGDGV